MTDVLTYQEAEELCAQIRALEDRRDPEDAELYDDMYARAVRYANIRAGWNMLTREKKLETDDSRTSAHDAFIIALNIVARLQGAAGAGWRARLGDERKRIGDFACYLALFLSLEAR